MKTLICIPCLLTGGTEIQTLNTVQALVQGGHEVTVACYFEHTPDMVARYRKAGAEVILFSPEGVRVGGYKSILFLYRHLRRAIRMVRPDVVHVQYMAPGAMVILLLWLMGVKNIIATAHTAADIYRDLRLIHFLQRRCLRAFTCITERAERSFFGTSQLYTPDLVLGRRNHFTIYNSLPARLGWSCNENEDDNENCSAVTKTNTKTNTASGVSALNLTQNTQTSLNNISEHNNQRASQRAKCKFTCDLSASVASEDINQRDLDTITQNTHCYARVGHPEGDTKLSTLNAKQELSHADSTDYTDSCKSLRPCTSGVSTEGSSLTAHSQQLIANSQEPTAKRELGVVSRIEPIKGMDLVVPALAEVLKAYPATRLLVVGDGTLRASMEEQAAQLGCASHIRFVGRQPQEELSQWYTQMDIVLMPSRSEGFGLTAIEAMAHGCVMVASDVGGLPEVVRDGICGLLHRTEDVADMAAKVCTLIGDETLYARLRAQSLVEVEKYSFERYSALMNDLYNKLGR